MTAAAHFDVCVVGAGPAGSIAAHVLARSGARVALFSPRGLAYSVSPGETVPAETRLLLSRLGIEGCLTPESHLPSAGSCSKWGSDVPRYREAILSSYGNGWHLDRNVFRRQLIHAAKGVGVTVVESAVRVTPTGSPAGWELSVQHRDKGGRLTASIALDCTGRRASVGMRHGAQRRVYDKLVATWAIFEQPPSRDGGAFEPEPDRHIFLQSAPHGWLYAAPLPQRRYAIAYFTDGDLAVARSDHTRSEFLRTLRGIPNLTLPFDTVRCRLIAGPARVSAASTRLIQAFGNRWIAAGDSAQSFDPLSSIGITSAIVSGNNAAAALIHAPSFGAAPLRQYQHGLDAEYSAYLSKRHEYYRMERRWQGMPFWNRRHHAEVPQARRNDPLSMPRTGVS